MNWIKKTTSLILSIAMLTSTMFVGSFSTTAAENNVSTSGSDDVYTSGPAPNKSWQGKSLTEIKKMYTDAGGDYQYYDDAISDKTDLLSAISAINNDEEKCMLHILKIAKTDGDTSNTITIDQSITIPSNTYIACYKNIYFTDSGNCQCRNDSSMCF